MPLSDLTLQSRSKNTPPDLQQPQFTVNDSVRTGTMIHMARYFETHANLPGHISVWDYWYHEPQRRPLAMTPEKLTRTFLFLNPRPRCRDASKDINTPDCPEIILRLVRRSALGFDMSLAGS